MNNKTVILMSTYNGEKFIREQLNSLLQQTVDVSIEIRDDGSCDGTWDILCEYAEKNGEIHISKGENLGYAKSFWTIMQNAPKADFYAFCDQDDVWDKDKLEIAQKALEKENRDIPLLYFSDVRVTDEKLNIIKNGMIEEMPVDYAHSLIKNIAPGCTFVFNNKALEFLKHYDIGKYPIDIHDWTAYRIIACLGKVVFDKTSHISYRQHGKNALGANKNRFNEAIAALKRLKDNKNTNSRSRFAQYLEQIYGENISGERRYITELMAHYRENRNLKSEFLKSQAFKFRGIKYLYFKIMVLLNKV